MKKTFFCIKLFFFLIGNFFIQAEVIASGCNRPISKPITFERGAYCWSYKGKATDFYGNFRAGQKISVKLIGWDGTTWEALDPIARIGNNVLSTANNNGELSFFTQSSAKYTFDVSPCAYWGAVVQFTVCAS